MFWLDEQNEILKKIDSTWNLIRETVIQKAELSTLKQKRQLSNWFTHLSHIYDELKIQQNWDPNSSLRKKIMKFLWRYSILKPQYPGFSPIWTGKNPVWPVSSSVPFTTLFGFDLHVSGRDFWSVTATGHYKQELSESLLILRLLPRVEAFIDVGANVGFYSLLAAKVCDHPISVLAFEPEAENFGKLQQAIQANDLDQKIHPFPMAIGSSSQKMKLYHSAMGSGGNSVAPPEGSPMSEESEIVESTTLDEVQKKHLPRCPPTLIKIDVECFEYEVLRGASNWLAAQQAPTILIEMATKSAHSNKNHVLVIKKLKSFGYRVYPVLQPMNGKSPLGKECSPFNYKSPTWNFLAIPPCAFSLTETLQAPIDIRVFTRNEHLQALLAFLKNSLNSLENE